MLKRAVGAVTRSLLQRLSSPAPRGRQAAPSQCPAVNSLGSGAALSSKVGALLGGRGRGGEWAGDVTGERG